ncbi:peptide chain release factor N(5)-glutamine methyltransferase [Marinicauda algicola]|uniref:peptide chain release factor N(5)-glutamine methyltransferase n=1 Tax=Marinicauda algicola TaxID=2029849 RepID=UPI0019D1C586|nr:peptide chain release factor N(5)-glutamine methyltransferase [Marinicauda algicola]
MTRAEALRCVRGRLEAAGIEDAAFEARQLILAAAGLERSDLAARPEQEIGESERAALDALLARRLAREPLSHILGSQPFWTLDLKVTPDVLTPRADTETVVEVALEAATDRSAPLRILDIATGSGAIALALLSELSHARAVATDLCPAALAVARENAARHGLASRIAFVGTSWADGVGGRFDLIVSNPPYIASSVIDTLDPEVKDHEPRLALDGGADGLDPYPRLFAEARRLLGAGGTGVFEIGFDQGEAVLALAREAGAGRAELRRDLAGRHRAIVFDFG